MIDDGLYICIYTHTHICIYTHTYPPVTKKMDLIFQHQRVLNVSFQKNRSFPAGFLLVVSMLRHQATGILYEHLQSTGQCQAGWIECMNGVCGFFFCDSMGDIFTNGTFFGFKHEWS